MDSFFQTNFAETTGHLYITGNRLCGDSERWIGGITKDQRKLLEMRNTLVILIVIIICVYTYVKTYQTVYIIYLQFIVCQLYSDKVIIKNKIPVPSGKKGIEYCEKVF